MVKSFRQTGVPSRAATLLKGGAAEHSADTALTGSGRSGSGWPAASVREVIWSEDDQPQALGAICKISVAPAGSPRLRHRGRYQIVPQLANPSWDASAVAKMFRYAGFDNASARGIDRRLRKIERALGHFENGPNALTQSARQRALGR